MNNNLQFIPRHHPLSPGVQISSKRHSPFADVVYGQTLTT